MMLYCERCPRAKYLRIESKKCGVGVTTRKKIGGCNCGRRQCCLFGLVCGTTEDRVARIGKGMFSVRRP